MRAPVRGKRSDRNQQQQNDRPSANTHNYQHEEPGFTEVKAPLLATKQQQNYDTNALSAEEEYQKQRLSDIEDVQQASAEVQALFRDFKTMTDSQQEGIDAVEKNIDKSEDHVVKGTGELKKANAAQKCSRKIMCAGICIVVVIVAIVIIVLYTKGDL